MLLQLEIDTYDRELCFDLMGNPKSLGSGVKAVVSGDVTVTLGPMSLRKSFGIPETITLFVEFSTGVGASLFAAWLYNKIQGRSEKIRIEHTEIELDEGQIKRIITHKMERN